MSDAIGAIGSQSHINELQGHISYSSNPSMKLILMQSISDAIDAIGAHNHIS